MSRIVSVWLPRWPILRFFASQTKQANDKNLSQHPKPVAPERPFVLAVAAAGGPRIAALNEAAAALGLTVGEPLADARAKAGVLQVRTIDPGADDAALRRLALWATRYTPTASPLCKGFWGEDNGADGFFLDVEGAAHLFGGEESLLADLAGRLEKNFGLPARLAVADTAGAAWALSRFHAARLKVLPSGEEAAALAPLSIDGLRLTPATRATLRRLGFKTIGSLLDKPRAPFAARFPAELLRRIDQALGRIDEPLVPIVAPPVYHSLHYLLEPIFSQEAIVARASRLMQTLTHVLARDDVGARSLRLSLYNVDGAVETIDIGLTLPTRSVAHVARLIALKLEALAATQDAGFGFEAVGLAVTLAEPMPARQTEFTSPSHPSPASGGGSGWGQGNGTERCAALIDALRQRLGPASVRRFAPVASHIPERAEVLSPVDSAASAWPEPEQTRPLLLLPHAEPAEDVTALVPEGPPRRFRWRGVTYDVTGAQGPERIGAEWWRQRMQSGAVLPTRDYYLVEDAEGHRFWLYREGLYGRETTDPHWFVHGLFA
jgi:protein ImuB